MTGALYLTGQLRLYPPGSVEQTPLRGRWSLLALLGSIILYRYCFYRMKTPTPTSPTTREELSPAPSFSLQVWREQAQAINTAILTPLQKADQLFCHLQYYAHAIYGLDPESSTADDLLKVREHDGLRTATKKLYQIIYTTQGAPTHRDIKELVALLVEATHPHDHSR